MRLNHNQRESAPRVFVTIIILNLINGLYIYIYTSIYNVRNNYLKTSDVNLVRD
jgi:hypothetical protein